ncbi:MAG: glutaredoxin-related protein [Bacteroidales bacterium]
MVKIYVMATCPDCVSVKRQAEGDKNYQLVDIGKNVRDLKEFLLLRDSNPAFDAVKAKGSIGIPCFVLDDGSVTLSPEEAGLKSRKTPEMAACNIDGSGC